jgi:hypothetical protein
MQVYDLHDEMNRVFAFEIENLGIGRRGVCHAVGAIPGATFKRKPKFLSWFREDAFCEFLVDGEIYIVEEPYGDNSRY